MGDYADAAKDGCGEIAEDKLELLGPGCFVQSSDVNGYCCWVEIVSIVDSGYECIAHPSLSDSAVHEDIAEGLQLLVQRDQITAMGCDRYCFC